MWGESLKHNQLHVGTKGLSVQCAGKVLALPLQALKSICPAKMESSQVCMCQVLSPSLALLGVLSATYKSFTLAPAPDGLDFYLNASAVQKHSGSTCTMKQPPVVMAVLRRDLGLHSFFATATDLLHELGQGTYCLCASVLHQ